MTGKDMQMVATAPLLLPLVDLRPVADGAHQWVALHARLGAGIDHGDPGDATAWPGHSDFAALFAAIAPLDCVLHAATPAALGVGLIDRLPAARTVLAFDGPALAAPDVVEQVLALQGRGFRILVDGDSPPGIVLPPLLQAVARDYGGAPAGGASLPALFSPHLAYGVDLPAQFSAAAAAGFAWFSGGYVLQTARGAPPAEDGGITARRLLQLLGLLLADAPTHAIEIELKQDPALSFQLLRLANSAAFAPAKAIHSFAQAIDLLGRRQLMRWLQLLLYARPGADGSANPLLPLAALRAAQVESLCRQQGSAVDQQDQAFQIGVFSLLDVLLGMPMQDIVQALRLPSEPAAALLERSGKMGAMLALVEAAAPPLSSLDAAEVTPGQWWASQLDGFHWAIQVSRNL